MKFLFLKVISGILGLILIFNPTSIALADSTQLKNNNVVVRVLVAENQKSMKINVKGVYRIYSLPARTLIASGTRIQNRVISASSNSLRMDNKDLGAASVRIEVADNRDLFVNKARFRGAIHIFKDAKGLLYAINEIDMEHYLYGVLHHEVSAWWPMEALKSQAIAARTYALYQAQVSKNAAYDLKSSTSSQVYGGSTTERFRSNVAVNQTAGQVLVFEGKIFPAYFHAVCAGMTASADEIWRMLKIKPISGMAKCDYCRISPHYSWRNKVTLADIEDKMAVYGRNVGQILDIRLISRTPSGRVGSLIIIGTQKEMTVAAKDFRIWIGGNKMKSTIFSVHLVDDSAVFEGRGWGHGVGLCQWGALGQSLLGKKHLDILGLYYPGAKIMDYRIKK